MATPKGSFSTNSASAGASVVSNPGSLVSSSGYRSDMTWELSDEEKEGVYSAPDEKRYAYFVGHVADQGEAWALKNGENWASLTDGGNRYFPVWPHPAFAEENLDGEWVDNE